MQNITFDQLPEAVAALHHKVDELLAMHSQPPIAPQDDVITLREAADFLDLANATIYGLVSRREIPHNKRGKRLYFSRKELESWIKSGRKKTVAEIQSEAGLKVKGGSNEK